MDQDQIKVRVTYPDHKGEHITTIAKIKQKFRGERKSWRERLISDIIEKGEGRSTYGTYTRIDG